MKASALTNPCRLLVATLFTVLVATIVSIPAHAEQGTDSGYVTLTETGWGADMVRVGTTAPQIDPANCPVKNYGYQTSPSDPGNHAYQAALLEAYRTYLIWGTGRVQLVISSTKCSPAGLPLIVGVTLHR
jgi:hypothetical protein